MHSDPVRFLDAEGITCCNNHLPSARDREVVRSAACLRPRLLLNHRRL